MYLSQVRSPIAPESEFEEAPVDADGNEVVETPPEEQQYDTNAFEQTLQTQYGLTKDELVEGIKLVREMAQQKSAATDYGALQEAWQTTPTEAEQRLTLIKEYWSGLPSAEQKQLDNVPGAMYIWNTIERSRSAKNSTATGAPTGTMPQSTYDFTQAQLDALPETERQRLDKQITYAYANGRVKGA